MCESCLGLCGLTVYLARPFMSDGLVTLSFELLHLDLCLLDGHLCHAGGKLIVIRAELYL